MYLVQAVRMAFSLMFDANLSELPFPLGEVHSNVFLVQGMEGTPWSKVRIGLYSNVDGVGLVELSNNYVPVGDGRIVRVVVPVLPSDFNGVILAFAEVIFRYKKPSFLRCKIYSGDVQDMIFDSIDPAAVAEASATKNEVPSDIINTSATPVSIGRPANPLRKGGFLQWEEIGTIYIGFGRIPARKLTSRLVKGSKIEIPPNFIGEIQVDWNGNQVAPNAAASLFKTLLCVEYVG